MEHAVRYLTAALALRPGSATAHFRLGIALVAQEKPDEGIAEYREAIRLKPDLYGVHAALVSALQKQGRLDEGIAEYRAAIRANPDSAGAHNGLGRVFFAQRKFDEAIAEFREATRIKPDYAPGHLNLGYALRGQGKLDEAIAAFREAIRIDPNYNTPRIHLGSALRDQGKLDEAIAVWRESIRLRPDNADTRYVLAETLRIQGKIDAAIVECREALRLTPESPAAHNALAGCLYAQGKLDEAIAEVRAAIRIQPDSAQLHRNLGLVLLKQGTLDQALVALRDARARAGPEPEKQLPGIGREIAGLERQLGLLSRLPAALSGQDRPTGPTEGIEFGELCYQQGLYAASARLYADALTADPKLGDDRRAAHRYNAACAAALAGCGKGKDDPGPNDATRASLRGQALDWLKIELVFHKTQAAAGDIQANAMAMKTLQHWKADTDLTGVRDREALDNLPEVERKAWQALWADVDSVLRNATGQHR